VWGAKLALWILQKGRNCKVGAKANEPMCEGDKMYEEPGQCPKCGMDIKEVE